MEAAHEAVLNLHPQPTRYVPLYPLLSACVAHVRWYLDREGKEERDLRQIYSLTATPYRGLYLGLLSVIQRPRDISEGPIDPDGKVSTHNAPHDTAWIGYAMYGINDLLYACACACVCVWRPSRGMWCGFTSPRVVMPSDGT